MRNNRHLPSTVIPRILAIFLGLISIAATHLVAASPALAAPPTPNFGPAIEGYAPAQSQTTCDPVAKPGVVEFRDLLNRTYGTHTSSIVRSCDVGGTSEHKEGRALDYHFNVNIPDQAAAANDLLNWLLATDRHGNVNAMARRFGIMYIIWNRRIWQAGAWKSYTGASPHTDHIHFSFGWPGARKQTSWWTARLPRDRSVSDVTGDGFADLLAYRANGELLQYDNNILINPGGVPYSGGRSIGQGWGGFKHVLAADVTGDGFAEAIAVNAEGRMYQYDNNILINPSGVPYTGGREVGHGWQGFKKLLAADVSGDGSADILGISAENDLWYYPNNRGSNPGGVPFIGGMKIGEGWDRFTKVLLGDITGDSYADVLGIEPNGHMFLFPNNIGVSPDRPYGYSLDIGQGWGGFATLIAADVSGDGSADVLGVDPGGQMRYYPNNSGSNPGGLPFTGGLVVGVGWQGLTIASSS
ncbi:tachylectin-related carbohydrate-binding protein [Nonomuraea sp. NPDC049421]|uniref:tachylectin-related carbohydrate-binding protein n=1 Tax=Nonomuraea sp. NPDC049421 TaxID=3155275 RepID=UPI0034302F0D